MSSLSVFISISMKQGRVGSPGIVLIEPINGYTNPAPTLALTSRTGRTKPVGLPYNYNTQL